MRASDLGMFEEGDLDIVGNTREDIANWRASDRPVYDAVHAVLEVALAFGQLFRLLGHFLGHGLYREFAHGEPGEYRDEMFAFDRLVVPVLEPEHWHQEALMRGSAFVIGLAWWSSHRHVGDALDVLVVMLTAGYLLLDPVLGLAWHIARGSG